MGVKREIKRRAGHLSSITRCTRDSRQSEGEVGFDSEFRRMLRNNCIELFGTVTSYWF